MSDPHQLPGCVAGSTGDRPIPAAIPNGGAIWALIGLPDLSAGNGESGHLVYGQRRFFEQPAVLARQFRKGRVVEPREALEAGGNGKPFPVSGSGASEQVVQLVAVAKQGWSPAVRLPTGPSPAYRRPQGRRWPLERFRRSFYNRYSGFAEKWHEHLARDRWTSSAGCRCHVVKPRWLKRDSVKTCIENALGNHTATNNHLSSSSIGGLSFLREREGKAASSRR